MILLKEKRQDFRLNEFINEQLYSKAVKVKGSQFHYLSVVLLRRKDEEVLQIITLQKNGNINLLYYYFYY